MVKENFIVSNVKCAGCATILQEGLQLLSGVSEVQVNVASGQVVVGGDALERQVLQSTLAELGYPVIEIR